MGLEFWEAKDVIPLVAICGGVLIAIISIIMSTIRTTVKTKQVEATRREVAAYVAEGSITPEDAERILSAGSSANHSCCSKRA